MLLHFAAIVTALAVANALPQSRDLTSTLPIVDLGYELHQAANINSTGPLPYYNFTNIRFGQAPVGHLRFAPPVAPRGTNKTVTAGLDAARICPQARPAWEAEASLFISAYLSGKNISAFTSGPLNTTSANETIPTPGPSETEDCLFLDVVVPTNVFDGPRNSSGAPVLVWIYGGGYVFGSKLGSGNPATLISRSAQANSDGIIFVALNYRLGLFGWLAGDQDITANVGLLDQRLALEWVKEHIAKFGGDPNQVTVMGESAGGGSIMHHIASPPSYHQPFQQAIPQSPAYEVFLPPVAKTIFQSTLKVASIFTGKNISCAADLRALPFSALYTINAAIVGTSPYGTFTYGPVVDHSHGSYVPDIPLRRVATGHYHKNITVLVGHNSNEGLLFTPPFTQTNAQFRAEVAAQYPTMSNASIDYVTEVLYPPIYNGSQPYIDQIGRTSTTTADALVGCNSHALASTPGGFGYFFSIPPGLHAEDTAYTFFNGDTSTSDDGLPVQAGIAAAFQSALVTFASQGAEGLEKAGWRPYGNNFTVTNIGLPPALGTQIRDPGARELQCDFWAAATYDK